MWRCEAGEEVVGGWGLRGNVCERGDRCVMSVTIIHNKSGEGMVWPRHDELTRIPVQDPDPDHLF